MQTLPDVFPIFPLSQVLLVPGALLPLHIFEPRYREMVADSLSGHQMIAMAVPRADADDPDRPRVHSVCTLGRIVQHEALPDGRSNIVLEGVARMQIDQELTSDRPYRLVEGRELPDVSSPDETLEVATQALIDRFDDLEEDERRVLASLPPERVLDALLLHMPLPLQEKLRIYSLTDFRARLIDIQVLRDRLDASSSSRHYRPGDPRLN